MNTYAREIAGIAPARVWAMVLRYSRAPRWRKSFSTSPAAEAKQRGRQRDEYICP